MDWKDFLKPTKAKLLVFALLAILVPWFFYLINPVSFSCSGGPSMRGSCPPEWGVSFETWAKLLQTFYIAGIWWGIIFLARGNWVNLIFFAVLFLLTYLVSCALVSFFHGIKKPKKKKNQ